MCYYIFIGRSSFFNSWIYTYHPSLYVLYTTPVITVFLDGFPKSSSILCFIARKREVSRSITVSLKFCIGCLKILKKNYNTKINAIN